MSEKGWGRIGHWLASESSSRHMIAGICGALLGTVLVTVFFWQHYVSTGVLRYADTNLPMLDTPDAYFFLERAKDMLQNGIGWGSVSALSTLLALIQRCTWLPPEAGGFWLPVLFSAACGLCYAVWGHLLRLPAGLSGMAALLGTLSPMFAGRVHAGNLDTDGVIFLLLPLCLYALARLALPGQCPGKRKKMEMWLGLAVCSAILVWLWIPSLILLACGIWLWALTGAWAEFPMEARIRRIIAIIMPAVGIPLLLLTPTVLPASFVALRDALFESVGFIANPRSDVIYQSIAELQGLSVTGWLTGFGASAWAGGVMLLAFALLFWRMPGVCLFLLPCVILQSAGFGSNRFLFFGALPMALGAAALPLTLRSLLSTVLRRITSRVREHPIMGRPGENLIAGGFALICLAMILWGEVRYQQDVVSGVSITRADDAVALELRRAISVAQSRGEQVALMNWWDEGYFLHYRVGVRPFFDGGSQAPLPAFIAARGFAIDHPQLARRWIRYFALHGERGRAGWDPLVAAWKDENRAVDELSALFLLPDDKRMERLAAWPALTVSSGGKSRTLSTAEDKAAWLFPSGHVYIFLPLRFLSISPWWMAMGDRFRSDMSLVRQHLEMIPRAQVTYDPRTSRLILPQQIVDKGYANGTLIIPTPEHPFVFPWGADMKEPLVLLSQPSPWCFLTNRLLARTTAFRLLAPSCESIPGFSLVAVNFGASGAWEVLE